MYSPVFYLRVLQKWYDGYMIIQKGFVSEVDLLRFGGTKEFQRSCVALVMGQFNLYEVLRSIREATCPVLPAIRYRLL